MEVGDPDNYSLLEWLCPLVCWSVGLLVGRVTHSFDDPHVAPYWPTWPYLHGHHRLTDRSTDQHHNRRTKDVIDYNLELHVRN